jgi:hypothetical protein
MDKKYLKQKRKKRRRPGKYPDKYSIKKAENNIFILHACKILNAYYTSEGITALILDGEHMRTTNILLNLGKILKKLIIVEVNKSTYDLMKIKLASKNINNITEIHNCLMDKYLENYLNPNINLVYFDLQENFFSSTTSNGSDRAINLFLQKSLVNEMIFAATFCLRSIYEGNFDLEENKILILLNKIFLGNGFKYRQLILNNKMRYKGQRALNKSLMFVLYKLTKIDEDKDEDNYDEN